MEIQDAIQKRRQLQSEIQEMVRRFEQETGLQVDAIMVDAEEGMTMRRQPERYRIVYVTVDCGLPRHTLMHERPRYNVVND